MVRPYEFHKAENPLQFALTALGAAHLSPRSDVSSPKIAVEPRTVTPFEVNLSGFHILVGLVFGSCVGSLLLWTFVRHWIFPQ